MNRYTNSFVFNGNTYYYCDLKKVFEKYSILRKLPNSLKILLEINIRNAHDQEISSVIATFVHKNHMQEIEFYPSRVVLQDFSGIPAIVDLASMRDTIAQKGANVQSVKPKIMVDLIISHIGDSTDIDIQKDVERNKEKYEFAKWAQNQFKNFSVIPPSSSISYQVNLEYLSTMLASKYENYKVFLYPETIVGTDTNATMINALGVLGWKVGGIEAESIIFGSGVSLNLPKVIGVEVVGTLAQGVSISDSVLSLSNIFSEYNVVGKFVEFYGSALKNISLEARTTLSNIASKYGAKCGYFGVDDKTIAYVEQTRGVDASLIKEYFIKQGMYDNHDLTYDEYLRFDLSLIKPIIAGPKKAEDKIYVNKLPSKLASFKKGSFIRDNDIVLASIKVSNDTSTSTLLIQAGLLAKRACELGLNINKNIKRSISYSSPVIKEYLEKLDLLKYLDQLGFNIVSYDESAGELVEIVSMDIDKFNLDVSSVTSDNTNVEGRLHSQVKSNWQMSPALVIAYSLKGNMNFDITSDPIFQDIYLSDVWPSINEVNEYLTKINYTMYQKVYKDVFLGNYSWQELRYENTPIYNWDKDSTYIQSSKFFEEVSLEKIEIRDAKILALLGDDIPINYLSPLGQILPYTPAALYLESKGLHPDEFNTFGSRKGNAEVMARGTLSNIRLKNKIVNPKEGGFTKDFLTGEIMSIYDFSMRVKEQNIPLVIFAGSEYGKGNAREWAAKGTKLLGVKAVIAKSFDKRHKSDLAAMGILPLEFIDDDIENLYLKGDEIITIKTDDIRPNAKIELEIKRSYETRTIIVQSRLDTKTEVIYYKNGGVLAYMLKNI